MMKTNTLNWFKIKNWSDLSFEYRLVEVAIEGGITDAKELNKAFNNAIKYLSSETKGVVSEAYHQGKKYIAVRADAELKQWTIPGVPLDIRLTPVEGTFTLDPKDINDDNNMGLAARFIESAIEYQFNRKPQIWNGGQNSFLKKAPSKISGDIQTDIYQGFKFRIAYQNKLNIYVCIDLAYRYVDKLSLSEILKDVPSERWNDLILGRNFLYQNGDEWYTVKGKNIGNSISSQMLDKPDFQGSVYEYIKNKGRYAVAKSPQPLDKNSKTFFHTYSKTSSNTVAGAVCLAKAIHFADNGMHKMSINDPNKRFNSIEFFAERYFQDLYFGGKRLQIATKPIVQECRILDLPSLKYANNQILYPYAGSEEGAELYLFPKKRREFIYKNGLLNSDSYEPQYLFVPDTLDFSFIKSLKFYFDRGMQQLDKSFPGFVLHQYSMKASPYSAVVCKNFQKMVADKDLTGGCGLFVLPKMDDNGRFSKYLHKLVKKELFSDLRLKCISETSLRRYMKPGIDRKHQAVFEVPDHLMRDFKSYQVNALFEYLIINNKWPYALGENLNYDLYIGIDAHEFYAGFVFFFRDGKKIVFDVEKTAKATGTFRNEKINFGVIRDKIVEVLSRHLRGGEAFPRSIVILRDGVSYGEEERALTTAIEIMKTEGKIQDVEIEMGVVDVAKTSALPLRAAIQGRNNILENPDCGTVVDIEKNKSAYLFNTGFPYRVPGSSNPLQVLLSWGNIDFEKALEDIFRLTQITFSSPDRPSSLPLPLKLIDTLIRDIAHEFDYANTQEKELKIIYHALKD